MFIIQALFEKREKLMGNTNNSNNNENSINESEKKNFTEILSDKAEKAGEAAADAVNHFTEMLTSKDKAEVENTPEQAQDIKKECSIKKAFSLKSTIITVMLVIYDLFAVSLSYFLALWVRFDCRITQIEPQYIPPYIEFIPFYAVFCVIIFACLKLYRSIWRYASVIEAFRIAIAIAITGFAHIIFITLFFYRMPISYYVFGPVIQFFLVIAIRFFYRFYLILRNRYTKK